MFSGIRYFFTGLGLIFRPEIKRFVLMPLLINISIFTMGLWFGME